jgi:electron transfer flavoprotein alpha subunit
MKSEIWVFIEIRWGKIMEVSLELIGKARELASQDYEVAAILTGDNLEPFFCPLFEAGADKIYAIAHPALTCYRNDLYPGLVTQLAKEYQPAVILMGATVVGRDLAPAVAALLNTGCIADCCQLNFDPQGELLQIVPAFGAHAMATIITPKHRPKIATIRPGVFPKPKNASRTGKIEYLSLSLPSERLIFQEAIHEATSPSSLIVASIVVAGGSGIGSRGGWDMLQELAALLNGALGGTRPAVDDGWVPESQMIGQSGQIIRPDLYIAVGISGDMQHMVGVQEAKVIVAINKDKRAPIFQQADYGIVGDYKVIIPLMLNFLKNKEEVFR